MILLYQINVYKIELCTLENCKFPFSPRIIKEQFQNPPNLSIIRHGPKDKNTNLTKYEDNKVPLSSSGVDQVKSIGIFWKELIDLILYSPIIRTNITAKLIAQYSNTSKIRPSNTFLGFDRYDLDKWIQYKREVGYQHALNQWLNGLLDQSLIEPYNKFIVKILSKLNELRIKYQNKNILIVTQEFIIIAILHYFNPELKVRKIPPLHGIIIK